ncbi:hypothetical protein, partial [Bacillus pumilus]|uniref:hypothetical protein n=1 Tax=Bacillus pumilus TaxID=1408 RepID=UPI001C92C917
GMRNKRKGGKMGMEVWDRVSGGKKKSLKMEKKGVVRKRGNRDFWCCLIFGKWCNAFGMKVRVI